MYSFLFRNKLGALAFVVLTMIGAATLVGTEKHDGVIAKTTQEIEKQREGFAEKTAALSSGASKAKPAPTAVSPEDIEFTADEDLVDEAEGYDPTPEPLKPDVNPDAIEQGNLAEEGEVIIILNGKEYTEPL